MKLLEIVSTKLPPHPTRSDDVQVVQSWRDIAHQCHEKQRNLKDMVRKEVETLNNLVIPGHRVKVEDERQKP